jgi:hypothetical protein
LLKYFKFNNKSCILQDYYFVNFDFFMNILLLKA